MTNEKFNSVSDWFTKPANLSPSAQVATLFEAVLSEVQSHHPSFKPKIVQTGRQDFEIISLQYHHIYDFLHVVVYNAAEHGNPAGELVSDIQMLGKTLQIEISSEISNTQNMPEVRSTINSYIEHNNENAMIVEGNSGIQKIFQLKHSIDEITDVSFYTSGKMITFRLCFELETVQNA